MKKHIVGLSSLLMWSWVSSVSTPTRRPMKQNISKLVLAVLALMLGSAQAEPVSNAEFVEVIDELAQSEGMEFVHGDMFPANNPYGSFGSTFVMDFTKQGTSADGSILFLARRQKLDVEFEKIQNPLVNGYDYFLVFAARTGEDNQFTVHDVMGDGVGLMGMSLYYGRLELASSQYDFFDEHGRLVNMAEVDLSELSVPIMISSVSSTQILLRHKDGWLTHIEIDW